MIVGLVLFERSEVRVVGMFSLDINLETKQKQTRLVGVPVGCVCFSARKRSKPPVSMSKGERLTELTLQFSPSASKYSLSFFLPLHSSSPYSQRRHRPFSNVVRRWTQKIHLVRKRALARGHPSSKQHPPQQGCLPVYFPLSAMLVPTHPSHAPPEFPRLVLRRCTA